MKREADRPAYWLSLRGANELGFITAEGMAGSGLVTSQGPSSPLVLPLSHPFFLIMQPLIHTWFISYPTKLHSHTCTVYLSIYLSVCLSNCLSICQSVHLACFQGPGNFVFCSCGLESKGWEGFSSGWPAPITIHERREGSWNPTGTARLTYLHLVSCLLFFSSCSAAVIYSFAISKIPWVTSVCVWAHVCARVCASEH